MNGGQIAVMVLFGVSLGCSLAEHGRPKTGTNNFFVSLLAIAIECGFLWLGGFWS